MFPIWTNKVSNLDTFELIMFSKIYKNVHKWDLPINLWILSWMFNPLGHRVKYVSCKLFLYSTKEYEILILTSTNAQVYRKSTSLSALKVCSAMNWAESATISLYALILPLYHWLINNMYRSYTSTISLCTDQQQQIFNYLPFHNMKYKYWHLFVR